MAGSPAQEASERQSRKRRGSHITPEKSKKSTSSQSPSRADTSTVKSAPMAPPMVKVTTRTAPATSKGHSTTNDKTKGPVGDGSTKPKVTQSDLTGKASKAKSGQAPAKDKKVAAKKDDNKDKKPVENKPDSKEDKENKIGNDENKDNGKDNVDNKSTKGPEIAKANQGVQLPDLVKPVPSDSESSTDDDSEDYEDSEDSESMDDSDDSDESDDSSETSESEKASDMNYFDEDLYNAFEMEYQDLDDMSPERLATEKAKTFRNVKAFIDNTKDKHYHHFKLETLTGPANYISWVVGLEVLLRVHQVWPVVGELNVPLDKDHEMYPWYDHMVNVAVSLIYAHVSQKIRSHRCFIRGVMQRSPGSMMQHIWAHFGSPDADQYEH